MRLGRYIRNILIAACGICGATALYKSRMRRRGPLVRVIVFHDVTDREWFLRTISHVASAYHIVSPEEFKASQFDPQRINVLITFDDGYASWTEVAAPVLAEKGIKALFFASSGLLDVHEVSAAQAVYVHDKLLLSPRKTLSWDGLRDLVRQGHTVGGHGKSHKRLSQLLPSAQKAEIEEDKHAIENRIAVKIDMFAYPFGRKSDYTENTKALVKEAEYVYAFTTESAFVDTKTQDTYAIPRLCIEDRLIPREVGRWVEGGYDIYKHVRPVCLLKNQ